WEELRRCSDKHDRKMISIEQIIEWRRHNETKVRRVVETQITTDFGPFKALGYKHEIDGQEHIELIARGVEELNGAEDVLVRVQSECLTSDVFYSRRCACR